jgi:hypothetical protein
MTRIFLTLASANGLLLFASFVLGILSKWHDSLNNPSDPTFWLHFLFGLSSELFTLLVHCIIFTYFLGTGRWVKEVKQAYDLPDDPWPKLTRDLKRRVFPPALWAMLTAIATGAAGAAAQVQIIPWHFHATFATLTLVVNFWAYGVEYRCLSINAHVLDQVLEGVERLRAQRGLPSNAEELRQREATNRMAE